MGSKPCLLMREISKNAWPSLNHHSSVSSHILFTFWPPSPKNIHSLHPKILKVSFQYSIISSKFWILSPKLDPDVMMLLRYLFLEYSSSHSKIVWTQLIPLNWSSKLKHAFVSVSVSVCRKCAFLSFTGGPATLKGKEAVKNPKLPSCLGWT